MKMLDWLVDWWLRRCRHDGAHVAADILEGSCDVEVKYCRRCGAVRLDNGPYRRPQPTWYPEVA